MSGAGAGQDRIGKGHVSAFLFVGSDDDQAQVAQRVSGVARVSSCAANDPSSALVPQHAWANGR